MRNITAHYPDAVSLYIENRFAQGGATAARAMVKAWTDKGGKVLAQSRAVPIKRLLVSQTVPAEEQEQLRVALLGMAAPGKSGRDALDSIGYNGFVALNPEVESATIVWLGL